MISKKNHVLNLGKHYIGTHNKGADLNYMYHVLH